MHEHSPDHRAASGRVEWKRDKDSNCILECTTTCATPGFPNAEVIPRSLRIEFCSNLISISKNLGSESKRTFQKSRKNRVKGEGMVSVHVRPSRGVPNHLLTSHQHQALFPDLPDSEDSPLVSHSPISLCKAKRRLFGRPSTSQPHYPHLYLVPGLLSLQSDHTRPRLENSTSDHVPAHQFHFPVHVVAAFPLPSSLHSSLLLVSLSPSSAALLMTSHILRGCRKLSPCAYFA